ncbi:MAG TPA: PDZ domain-containing protein, partial [Candidatus Sulfopaludibacter sp.]|nr:PDZ domain-containing protein [Candidatus Sulfopaludibacter sp.]
TVTMERPAEHSFHVAFRCDGLADPIEDFTMPAWAPGYYRIMDYEKYVSHFRARDGEGHDLPWEKVTPNTWRVAGAPSITVEYDVSANSIFGVQNYLNEKRGYISPPGLYMYVAGHLGEPVTVAIQTPDGWPHIATGLDRVPGKPNTFSAPDFDFLFDCPTLMGNQEALRFDVRGVPHYVAVENVPDSVNRDQMLADLKKMVEAATRLMGDIPYRHYTFLLMGTGNGGIEHLNSASISFSGNSLTSENGYRGWLSYVAHEYFHNFNVKRIRPIALGPFDYETENLTNMLWVSEGLSVYYQDLLLVRAGLITRQQYLEKMETSMGRFQSAGGHHYQSATDSSMHTWGNSGVGLDRNTTISYYENGGMIGAMLDLAIRHASRNARSLDDVMRGLYRKYYREKKRGFTDAEFRQECEAAAGAPMEEVLSYASTTRDPDYARYFAYAGLATSVAEAEAPGTLLGLNLQSVDGKLKVVGTAADSPAEGAGLTAGDELVEVEGSKATPKALSDLLAARKPGDRIKLKIARGGASQDMEVRLDRNVKLTYGLKPAPHPDPLQATILNDWLTAK